MKDKERKICTDTVSGRKKEKYKHKLPEYNLKSAFAREAYENFKYMKQYGNFEEDELGARELTGLNEADYAWIRANYNTLRELIDG